MSQLLFTLLLGVAFTQSDFSNSCTSHADCEANEYCYDYFGEHACDIASNCCGWLDAIDGTCPAQSNCGGTEGPAEGPCTNHADCGADEYCYDYDGEHACDTASNCCGYLDAVDGTCPAQSNCGGTEGPCTSHADCGADEYCYDYDGEQACDTASNCCGWLDAVDGTCPAQSNCGGTASGCACSGQTNSNGNGGSDCSSGYCYTAIGACADGQSSSYLSNQEYSYQACSNPTTTVYGCTDSSATNYNSQATSNDGSCTYADDCSTDSGTCGYWVDYGYTCDELSGWGYDCTGCCVYGCTDNSATNYNSQATSDDGSCTYAAADYQPPEGCTCVEEYNPIYEMTVEARCETWAGFDSMCYVTGMCGGMHTSEAISGAMWVYCGSDDSPSANFGGFEFVGDGWCRPEEGTSYRVNSIFIDNIGGKTCSKSCLENEYCIGYGYANTGAYEGRCYNYGTADINAGYDEGNNEVVNTEWSAFTQSYYQISMGSLDLAANCFRKVGGLLSASSGCVCSGQENSNGNGGSDCSSSWCYTAIGACNDGQSSSYLSNQEYSYLACSANPAGRRRLSVLERLQKYSTK